MSKIISDNYKVTYKVTNNTNGSITYSRTYSTLDAIYSDFNNHYKAFGKGSRVVIINIVRTRKENIPIDEKRLIANIS